MITFRLRKTKRCLALINRKAAAKKSGLFQLKEIPLNKEYLDNCIANKQDRIFIGLQLRLGEISVAKISKNPTVGTGGIDEYQDIKDIDDQTRACFKTPQK